ncbi:MAG: nickel-dependent lactate racemase [Lentisphaerae bacterium]|nr:nickel-dependent lactate racemase [Lentisphaerota bacterium]
MRYEVSYGREKLPLDVADERVVGVMSPNSVRPVADVSAAVQETLCAPFESAALADLLAGKRTALILTVDNTRPSPTEMLRPVLGTCDAADVTPTIMIAPGRHRLMLQDEIADHLGPEIMDTRSVLQHDAFDEASMVDRGVTARGTRIRVNKALFEHDVVIGCGIIEPSYLCGWSGGRKLMMPGLAHHESIDNNHFHLTDPATRIGRLTGNPVSDDAIEFASALPFHFIVYAVVGPNDEVAEIVSGDPFKAHAEACRRCAAIYQVDRMTADIVISSAGGSPYDFDLVQGKKAIIPASETVNENGVIILCAECPDGLGAEGPFIEWLRSKTPEEAVRDVREREKFNLGAHGANILARPMVEKNATVILVTRPQIVNQLEDTYVTAVTSLAEAWQLANAITGADSNVLFIEKARRLIVR